MGFKPLSKIRNGLAKLLLTSSEKRKMILDSDEYQGLEDENNNLVSAINSCQNTEVKYHDFMGETIISHARTEQKLKSAVRKIKGLEQKAQVGEVLHKLSKIGLIEVDKDHYIVDVNKVACDYLDSEMEDLMGVQLSQAIPSEIYLHNYLGFFVEQSKKMSVLGKRLQESVFKIGDVGFDVQGFFVPNEENEFKQGYLFITPYKERSVLEQLFGKRKVVVAPEGALVFGKDGNFSELCPLVDDIKYKEVNLSESSANEESLRHLLDYYNHFNKGRFVFSGVSEFERAYLIELGVDEKDILSIRKSQEETGQFPAVNPTSV